MEALLESSSEEESMEYVEEELSLESHISPDLMYSRKEEVNNEESEYELDWASDELSELEEYLEDIKLGQYSEVEEIAVDLESEKAFVNDGEIIETYELAENYGESKLFKARIYGRDEASLIESNYEGSVIYQDDCYFEAGNQVETRINLVEKALKSPERAKARRKSAKNDREFEFRMGQSMKDMLGEIDGASEMKFRNSKVNDTLLDLSMGGVGDVDTFTEYVENCKKWKKMSDNRIIETKIGDYRFYTVDGSQMAPLQDKTIYGVAASTKNNGINQDRVMNLLTGSSAENIKNMVEEGVSL